jgi:uncharacterized membrane protein
MTAPPRPPADRTARFVHLLLAGVLTGNEFGSWVAVHPALDTLPARHRLPAEQALYRRYGRVMPVLMTATLAAAGPVLARTPRGSPAHGPTVASTACYAAMLAVTLTGNLPLNRRLLALPDTAAAHAELARLRSRWDRLHSVRNVLNLGGLALAVAAALRR